MDPTDSSGGGGASPQGRYELRVDVLGQTLRARHASQAAAASELGIDRGHLNDILRGRTQRPGVKFMEALRNSYPDAYDDIVVWVVDTDRGLGEAG